MARVPSPRCRGGKDDAKRNHSCPPNATAITPATANSAPITSRTVICSNRAMNIWESCSVHSGKVAIIGATTTTSPRCNAKNWPREATTLVKSRKYDKAHGLPVVGPGCRVADGGKGHGGDHYRYCRQHAKAADHHGRVVEADGLPGQDEAKAHSCARGQRGQTPQQVAPVGTPPLGQGVAAGQHQPKHHGSRADGDHRAQRLPGECYGQEGGERRLRGDEECRAGGANDVDGQVSERTAQGEMHQPHRCDPGQKPTAARSGGRYMRPAELRAGWRGIPLPGRLQWWL